MFITFEGPDGCGKTTQAAHLAQRLKEEGHMVCHTREPGGTPIGEQIREVLHNTDNTEMDPVSEVLLYSASRAQHVAQVIRPALKQNQIVVCDRFYDSTLAYQGYGHGLSLDMLNSITAFATGGLVPDLTIYLEVSPETGLQRRQQDTLAEWNRLDAQSLAFHQRVHDGYQHLIKAEPARWVQINGERDKGVIEKGIWLQVQHRLTLANQT